MADFNNAVMTDQGAALLAQCSGGFVKMEFTQLVTGDGEYTEAEKTRSSLQQRKTLKNTRQTFPFSKIEMHTQTSVLLAALITNEELKVGYYVREVGIYARAVVDDDAEIDEAIREAISTEPILYSIAVANIADYLPPYNGLTPSTITQEYYATVANSADVTITTGGGAVALAEDLDALAEKVKNLTASEIGYDNTTTGMEARNVQEAIDEAYARGGGGSVVSGVTTEESLFLKTVTASKDGEVLATAKINIAGQYTLSGIRELGNIKISAENDEGEVADLIIQIPAYSKYTANLSFYRLYGLHVADDESDPEHKVTYLPTCHNAEFTPAKMNYATGEFEPGSWTGDHAWFMPRPCMLKYDGTVDYYLDPNDYTKKEDGTPSDVANTAYGGNAMMEWGQHGKKIWIKIVPTPGNIYEGDVYICDKQLDDDFHAWSHVNNQDILADHFYTAIYNGSLISNRLRSISGQSCINSKTATEEVTAAKANNAGGDVLWYTETYADRFTVNMLLLMMAKTTDTQAAYGRGYEGNTSANAASYLMNTGTMDKKGLFWGDQHANVADKIGVKVFGMENWWGNQWRRIAGYINANGTIKVKMTYGTADGSTAVGYNETGNGYLTIANATPDGTSSGFISKMIFDPKAGLIMKTMSGSASTHFTDGAWYNNSQVDYAFVGGDCPYAVGFVGALCFHVATLASNAAWALGATLSCKPLAAAA